MSETILELENVSKIYNKGMENEVAAVKNVSLKIGRGEFVSIVGPSGSGKTTLLDIIGCLLRPTEGKVFVDRAEVRGLDENSIANIRGEKLGFVFQQYNLIPSATALENVSLALRINGKGKKAAEERAKKLLETVGLRERAGHRPSQLSGGEQQRVAIARALANNPQIILADEPTGNLDTKTGEKIMEVFDALNKKGYTIVMITHEKNVAEYAHRKVKLKDGEIVS